MGINSVGPQLREGGNIIVVKRAQFRKAFPEISRRFEFGIKITEEIGECEKESCPKHSTDGGKQIEDN